MKYIPTFEQFINESVQYLDKSKGIILNIDKETIENDYYRNVIFTANKLQLVLMNILPGQEIGEEIHEDGDQFLRIEQGQCKVILDDIEYNVQEDSGIVIKSGVKHNIINTGSINLKLYSIYAPVEHPEDLKQKNK